MGHRAFVKVVGFSATERHALNTAFRLSDERHAAYSLWTPEAAEPPALLLLDGESAEGRAELQLPVAHQARLVWVGPEAPEASWRVFERPIAWPQVIGAMDALFEAGAEAAAAADVDLDLGGDGAAVDTQPPDTEPPDTLPPEPRPLLPRALIASADREQRLYLRARLALVGLTTVDDVETAGDAVECVRRSSYRVAIVEHQLPQVDAWFVLKRLRAIGPDRPVVILLKHGATLIDRLHAWGAGAAALLPTPPDPGALDAALRRVATETGRPPPALATQPAAH